MSSWHAIIVARIPSEEPEAIPRQWAQRTGFQGLPLVVGIDKLSFAFRVEADSEQKAETEAEATLKRAFEGAEVVHVHVDSEPAILWTYCLPYDDGAAPNPYWGVCTLAICKPVIRRNARVGDWVVGTGSKNSPIGDLSGSVVYAMRVSAKLTMAEYDALTRSRLSNKIPVWNHRDRRRRLGDSIYDFASDPPALRPGVHLMDNRATDLGGQYVLLSDHFYYFGDHPTELPDDLLPIVRQGQGYKSVSNELHVGRFVEWIDGLGVKPNSLMGKPQVDPFVNETAVAACAADNRKEALEDERLGASGESEQ